MTWWGGESFGSWMWNVAFDGIGSTAVATAVAVLLVMRQLRADRAGATEAAFAADCRRLRDRCMTMQNTARSSFMLGNVKRWSQPANADEHDAVQAATDAERDQTEFMAWEIDVLDVAQRQGVSDPCFEAVMFACRRVVHETLSPTRNGEVDALNSYVGALLQMSYDLTTRINEPDHFRRLSQAECDDYVKGRLSRGVRPGASSA